MKINITLTAWELWFWRLMVPVAVIWSLWSLHENSVMAERINFTLGSLVKTNNAVILLQNDMVDAWTVLNRMAEDYPPKKTAAQRAPGH